jgi:hypothetical protein
MYEVSRKIGRVEQKITLELSMKHVDSRRATPRAGIPTLA